MSACRRTVISKDKKLNNFGIYKDCWQYPKMKSAMLLGYINNCWQYLKTKNSIILRYIKNYWWYPKVKSWMLSGYIKDEQVEMDQVNKWISLQHRGNRGCPPGVMVKVPDCGIIVSKFKLQSHYYVHFRTNTLENSMNTLIFPAMGYIVPLLSF